jgi:F-type H+-transporting ATPase subunit b
VFIDWFTVGAQVVNFLILVVLLKKFLYGPITQAMSAREAKIQAQLVEAETRRQEAAAAETAMQQRLQELEDKRQALAAQVEADVARQKKILLETARQEVGQYRQGWLQALAREKAAFAQTVQERCSLQVFAQPASSCGNWVMSPWKSVFFRSFSTNCNSCHPKMNRLSGSPCSNPAMPPSSPVPSR